MTGRLRFVCSHGRYDPHDLNDPHDFSESWFTDVGSFCPGGEFLADDALVIEKVDGEWRLPFELGLFGHDGAPVNVQEMFDDLAHALTVREGAG